jgi:hypothetical protein
MPVAAFCPANQLRLGGLKVLVCVWHDHCLYVSNEGTYLQPRLAMDTFAPEFAHYWLDGQRGDADVPNGEFGALDTPTQQAALIELAERVSAARSVV